MSARHYRVCGECAAELVALGGVVQENARIVLGTACDRHSMVAATAIVEAEIGKLAPLDDDTSELSVSEGDDDAPPLDASRPFGPVTELAARLLVSWSHKSEGGKADVFMVGQAVTVAKMLLNETGGR